MTSKYDPLGDYLRGQPTAEAPMSFSDIEKVIGASLPPKAVNHPAWWSNNTSNNTMTRVWLEAGFRSERVNVGARKLVFRRVAGPSARPETRPAPPATPPTGSPRSFLARVRAAMAGTVHVPQGVDLTAPTGEIWDAAES
ncbi:MAG: hypothetical protein ABI376_03875 [Caulobacteraceae bacterium]